MFETGKFIAEIEKRPALYNVDSTEKTNREGKEQHWGDIGRILYSEWDAMPETERKKKGKELNKKWKSIRDNFVKDLKLAAQELRHSGSRRNVQKKKRYVYTKNLQFLLPHIKARLPSPNGECSTNSDGEDIAEHDDFETEPYLSPEAHQGGTEEIVDGGPIPSKRKKAVASKNQTISNEEATPSIGDVDQGNLSLENMATEYIEGFTDIYGHKSFLMSFVPVLNDLPLHRAIRARQQISQVMQDIYCHPPDCTDECCWNKNTTIVKSECLED